MRIVEDIQPVTTFRNNSAAFLDRLKKTKRPMVLTVNGKAAAVIQDAESYQRLLDLAAEASAVEGIRQGREDLSSSRARDAREVFNEMRKSREIPR